MILKQWQLRSDAYVTDDGPICLDTSCQGTIYVYHVDMAKGGHTVARCHGCHRVETFSVESLDPASSIYGVKAAHIRHRQY